MDLCSALCLPVMVSVSSPGPARSLAHAKRMRPKVNCSFSQSTGVNFAAGSKVLCKVSVHLSHLYFFRCVLLTVDFVQEAN